MDSNKKITIAVLGLFLISAVYLSWIETRRADLNLGKNWWALFFAEPKSNNLSFFVENHSDYNLFHWIVFTAGKTKLDEGDLEIEKGAMAQIDLSDLEIKSTKRIIIEVTNGDDKKEIYRNFKK